MSAPGQPPADRPVGPASANVVANPLLGAFETATAAGGDIEAVRSQLITTYAFAVPSDEALTAIERRSPEGVVELGAGTGYWASLLRQRGVDVVAFDVEPAPSAQNEWFAGSQAWHPVHRGDHDVVGQHPERTLLIVWPTKDEIWAATALERYHDAGGECVAVVGEGPGGSTGDDVFHALLGELTTCLQCDHGATTSPCICSTEARWSRSETVALPHWPGYDDDLHIFVRRPLETPARAGGIAMSNAATRPPRLPPPWFVHTAWRAHRALHRLSGGRLLWTTSNKRGWGALRLTTIGRRSGQERSVILGYLEDGPDLVTLAMNGWDEGHPAWWLNLEAHPDAVVRLAHEQPRPVRARPAAGGERDRLWQRWVAVDPKLDAYAGRRSTETPVVVLEPSNESA